MPAVTRELDVTYGSTTVGGTDSVLLDGPIGVARSYSSTVVTFDAIVVGSASASAFKTACAALETAFTTPRQALTITLSSQTLLSLSHSANTGYNAQPTIEKIGDPAMDSGRSRRYRIRISFETPANLTGQNGLRDALVELIVAPNGIRTVRITGAYTALSNNSARDQHDANVATFATTQLTGIDASATWELVGRPSEVTDDSDKNLRFSRTYRERIYAQSQSATDDSEITEDSLVITRAQVQPGNSNPAAEPLIAIDVAYSASIVSSQTALKTVWSSKVLPHITARVNNALTTGTATLINATPVFVEGDNANGIRARLQYVARSSSGLLSSTQTTRLDKFPGKQYVGVWNGDEFARDEYPGFAEIFMTVTIEELSVAGLLPGGVSPQFTDPFQTTEVSNPPRLPAGYVRVGGSESSEPIFLGISSLGAQLELLRTRRIYFARRITVLDASQAPAGSGSGANGGQIPDNVTRTHAQ